MKRIPTRLQASWFERSRRCKRPKENCYT
jgi:hypothetical protein